MSKTSKDEADNRWIETHPELGTRPLAIAEMQRNRNLRRNMLKIMDDLLGVASRMRAHACAREVLIEMWKVRRGTFHSKWDGRISNAAFSQCYSALRNVWKNAMLRASTSGWRPAYRDLDVERETPEWLLEMWPQN